MVVEASPVFWGLVASPMKFLRFEPRKSAFWRILGDDYAVMLELLFNHLLIHTFLNKKGISEMTYTQHQSLFLVILQQQFKNS